MSESIKHVDFICIEFSRFLLNWLTCFIMLDLSKNKEQMTPGLMRYLPALGLKVLFLIPINTIIGMARDRSAWTLTMLLVLYPLSSLTTSGYLVESDL